MRLIATLLALVFLAGCIQGPVDDGNDTDDGQATATETGTPDDGPLPFTPAFDGARAYRHALAQMYDDPDDHTGPRYRIPGTEDSDTVAAYIHDALAEAVGDEGTVHYGNFTGADYFALDLRAVSRWVCDEDSDDRARVEALTFHNVYARTHPDEWGILIGAHWDTKRHAMGSDEPILGGDDGAGATGSVIELARVLTAHAPDQAFTFVLFDGEDGFDDCHPLAGSSHFAQTTLDDDRATARGLILLDMVGNESAEYRKLPDAKSYRSQDGETVKSAWLQDAVWDTAKTLGVDAFVHDTTCSVTDDHIPFLEAGVPSIDIIRYHCAFAPYWHTTRDDHTAISPAGLEQVGIVVESTLRLGVEEPEA